MNVHKTWEYMSGGRTIYLPSFYKITPKTCFTAEPKIKKTRKQKKYQTYYFFLKVQK